MNWSVLAESILRNYTREVYLATKNGGWDGQMSHLYDVIEEDSVVVTSQWDLAGSLLFSITVITTIGTSAVLNMMMMMMMMMMMVIHDQ